MFLPFLIVGCLSLSILLAISILSFLFPDNDATNRD